jgi:hypothetical protein
MQKRPLQIQQRISCMSVAKRERKGEEEEEKKPKPRWNYSR